MIDLKWAAVGFLLGTLAMKAIVAFGAEADSYTLTARTDTTVQVYKQAEDRSLWTVHLLDGTLFQVVWVEHGIETNYRAWKRRAEESHADPRFDAREFFKLMKYQDIEVVEGGVDPDKLGYELPAGTVLSKLDGSREVVEHFEKHMERTRDENIDLAVARAATMPADTHVRLVPTQEDIDEVMADPDYPHEVVEPEVDKPSRIYIYMATWVAFLVVVCLIARRRK